MSLFRYVKVATAVTFCTICLGELKIGLGNLNRIVKGKLSAH